LQIEDVAGAHDGQRIIRLSGPVLVSNFFQFQSLVRGSTSPNLILDVTQVPYIDSAGIGALVGAYVTHQKEGRTHPGPGRRHATRSQHHAGNAGRAILQVL